MTIKQIKAFLVEEMHYDLEDLAGLSKEELLDGLDEEAIEDHIA
jgi:hypothetical protein